MGFFDKIKQGLSKTKQAINDAFSTVAASFKGIDEDFLMELEDALILADFGVAAAEETIEQLRKRGKSKSIKTNEELRAELCEIIKEMLPENEGIKLNSKPSVILMLGVNGVGKTTTAGKLAQKYTQQGKKVMLAAADTFRAAAAEQLEIWAERTNCGIVRHEEGADPASVVFDAISAAKARECDIVICDTAGRLHNKKNLMNELAKIQRIIDRELPNADKEVLLVLDATTGQNAIAQAKAFAEVTEITGIVLTKLDGTAKGGVVVAAARELSVPVKLVGVGEGADDLIEFDKNDFAEALLQ